MMLHADLVGERARLTPDKLALVLVRDGARLTYAQLDRRAQAGARMLRDEIGLVRGDRLGLLACNRLEFLDVVFAAAKSGIVVVPLSTRLTAHELEPVIADSGMRAMIYDEESTETVRALRTRVKLDAWVALDGQADAPAYHALVAKQADAPFAREDLDGEDLFALLYTSGTTGRPKGVMIPHRMIAWNAYNTVMCWQLRDDDVSAIFTPLYHAGGLAVFLMPLFAIGGTIVLHQRFDASEVWRTIAAERCTVVLGVPTLWKMLLDAPEFDTADVSSVRWFISGGAPLPEYIADAYRRRGIGFKQGYGLTEVGVNCFSMTVDEAIRKPGSIGKPMMMTEARLASGELCLRGLHVCRGYWQAPDLTAASLDAAGWFHTGDMARCDADGFYYIAGRRKEMFISGGVNVYPAEIEAALLQHAAVADAAVVGVPHPTWGEVGVAFVVLRPGASVADRELKAFLDARLARFKRPRAFVRVGALPRTPMGKVQKAALLQMYAEGAQ